MIVTAGTVRKAVEATLKAHLQDAMTVISAAEDVALVFPRSWRRLADFTDLDPRLSPSVVTIVNGVPDIYRAGDGVDTFTWNVRVVFVVSGQDHEETQDRVGAMVAAGRTTLNTWPALGGLASGGEQTGEEYDLVSHKESRTTGAGAVDFRFKTATERFTPMVVPDVEIAAVTGDVDVVVTADDLTP